MTKPSLPKGTRDLGPLQMSRRKYILNIIEEVFKKYGFQPLETPAMENLSVLTGKYGEEGDKLLFRILNSGDFLKKATLQDFENGADQLRGKVTEKGLRYDLTVPFARYVVMNQHDITFPFKRYQIQPVWRADRPQKGRYREFYQCDADVVGTDSLICEADIVMIIEEVFSRLGIKDFTIRINHRKLLTALAELLDASDKASDLFVAMDKLDKIGQEGVKKELADRGFSSSAIEKLIPFFNLKGSNDARLNSLESSLDEFENGKKAIDDFKEIFSLFKNYGFTPEHLELDCTLARGLSYYTGAIFETVINNISIGSVSGGGRYDDLTGNFGLKDMSGIGFSFGIDRIYDVMEELDLFPKEMSRAVDVLIITFNKENQNFGLSLLPALRGKGISCEIYPDLVKLKKQFSYADKKNVSYVIVIGDEEQASGQLTLKHMETGSEEKLSIDQILEKLTSNDGDISNS